VSLHLELLESLFDVASDELPVVFTGGRVLVLAIILGMLLTAAAAIVSISYFSYSFYALPEHSGIPLSLRRVVETFVVSANRGGWAISFFLACLGLYICV
jgi:hypothetical protein